jgi:hypothetical protein
MYPFRKPTTSLIAPFIGSTQKEFEPQTGEAKYLACLTCLKPKEVTPLISKYQYHTLRSPGVKCPLMTTSGSLNERRSTELLWARCSPSQEFFFLLQLPSFLYALFESLRFQHCFTSILPHLLLQTLLSSNHLHSSHILHTMAATRMFAPKVASLMGSTSAKVARPILRSSVKANGSQRAFSGT